MHTLLAVDDEPANQRAVRRALSDDCRGADGGLGRRGARGDGARAGGAGDHRPAHAGHDGRGVPRRDRRALSAGDSHRADRLPRRRHAARRRSTAVTSTTSSASRGRRASCARWCGAGSSASRRRPNALRLLDELRTACARARARSGAARARLLALDRARARHAAAHPAQRARAAARGRATGAGGGLDRCGRARGRVAGARRGADARRGARRRARLFRCASRPVDARARCSTAAVAEMRAAARGRALDIAARADATPFAVAADPHWLAPGGRRAAQQRRALHARRRPRARRRRPTRRRDRDRGRGQRHRHRARAPRRSVRAVLRGGRRPAAARLGPLRVRCARARPRVWRR